MMKKLLSKVVLLSLFGMLVLSSCSKDSDGDDKVSVTEKYLITINGTLNSKIGTDSPGLVELKDYTQAELVNAIKTYGKTEWTITAKGDTEKEASAAADKKAIELFNSMLPNLNNAVPSLKTKFETKRGALAAKIVTENSYYVKYISMGGVLEKEFIAPTNAYFDELKSSDVKVSFEAIGGTQY